MKSIKDQVIIVTGASSGIGKALAQLLAKEGAKVVLAARSVDVLESLAAGMPDSLVVPTDMSEESSVKNLITQAHARYGRIDVLVNNAGQGLYSSIENVPVEEYRNIIDLNVVGPLVAMQQVIPIMRVQGGGHIVNISSLVSKNYFPKLGAYASTKYALNCLSMTARAELEPDGIIVSLMHPGMTETEFGKNAIKSDADAHMSSRVREGMPAPDSAEYIAGRILLTIQSGDAEVMAH